MQIPVDLYTAQGIRLEAGRYELEVKQQESGYTLVFTTSGRISAVVKEVKGEDSAVAAAEIPLVGTHYMRSSNEPVLTAFERCTSRTGKPRYEEEARDWKAALRVYRSQQTMPSSLHFRRGDRVDSGAAPISSSSRRWAQLPAPSPPPQSGRSGSTRIRHIGSNMSQVAKRVQKRIA